MSWTQLDGIWSRPLDCHDRLFQFIAGMGAPLGREHWSIMVNARIQLPKEPDFSIITRLQEAWKALRFRHPDIAIELLDDNKRYHPISNEKMLEEWCNETFRVEAASIASADDFFGHQYRLPGPYATLHWFPSSNQIALASSHWRWDGRGAIWVLHHLLSEFENPGALPTVFDGAEARNLVPSLDTVIGMPTEHEPQWEERADEMIKQIIAGQPSIGLSPPGDRTALPGDTRRAELVISAAEASALRAAAREQGITLTTAMHASAVIETVQRSTDISAKNFSSWAPIDVRKYCPAPFNGPVHAPSLRCVGLPLIVEARAPWHDLTESIHRTYHSPSWALDKGNMMFVRVPYVDKATALFKVAPQGSRPPTDPNISSLGILNDYVQSCYGSIGVEDISLMVHILSQQVYVHFWTWNGNLHISASYNEAYYTSSMCMRAEGKGRKL